MLGTMDEIIALTQKPELRVEKGDPENVQCRRKREASTNVNFMVTEYIKEPFNAYEIKKS